MEELRLLYELQQVEEHLAKLQKQLKELPVIAEFKVLQNQAADAKEACGWAATKLTEHRKRVKRMDNDLHQAEQGHQELQNSLYAGEGQSAKELEQLQRRVAAMQREKEEHEETVLTAMEGIDELEIALQKAQAEVAVINQKLKEKQTKGNEQINRLKEQILDNRAKRDLLIEQISEPRLSEYKQKRKQYGGRPLARVEGEICGGCRVSVSANLLSKLNAPDCEISCENCGRLLVKV